MWKIERDPYYGPLLPLLGLEGLKEAGWFEDTSIEDVSLVDNVPCTDLSKVRTGLESLPEGKEPLVLLSTGAHAPIHQGHLLSMEVAREAIHGSQYHVVGGFLSPGHDEYINIKFPGGAWPAPLRVAMVAGACKDSDWLNVCPWEALHCRVAVNFTDVIVRLQSYLQTYLGCPITVGYVAGGDNARFCLTFLQKGVFVAVTRTGYEHRLTPYMDTIQKHNDRMFLAPLDFKASSTAVRAGDYSLIPQGARNVINAEAPSRLLLRVEEEHEVLPGPGLDWTGFQRGLRETLEPLYKGQVRTIHVSAQRLQAQRVLSGNAISLDPLQKGPYNLSFSRMFQPGGYCHLGFTARPGGPSLEEQVSAIPRGEYALFDDDSVTGSTARFARSLLGPTRTVVQEHYLETSEGGKQEIADSRDFILGGKGSGLVVQLPDGRVGRLPYVYPFVCPTARVSVPARDAVAFSKRIWELNVALYQGSNLTLGDIPKENRIPFEKMGFDTFTSLYELAMYMYRRVL